MAELTNPIPARVDAAQVTTSTSPPPEQTASSPKPPARPRPSPLQQLYGQPAPIRAFPFPTLTNNPISLVHLAFTWISQVLNPPAAEPSKIHIGIWSPESRSIYVRDDHSQMELWRQGFYGKGTWSRSEPQWLKKEKIRQGLAKGKVAEYVTGKRRDERGHMKWERARLEQEARELTRLAEERSHLEAAGLLVDAPSDVPIVPTVEDVAEDAFIPAVMPSNPPMNTFRAPVGPLELLALPNSGLDLPKASQQSNDIPTAIIAAPVGPLELLALPNSHADLLEALSHVPSAPNQAPSVDSVDTSTDASGSSGTEDAETNTTASEEPTPIKRRKSVRFSDSVESTIFQHTDPPSPYHSTSFLKNQPVPLVEEPAGIEDVEASSAVLVADTQEATPVVAAETEASVGVTVVNKEVLQLAPEEAFFLVFGLGALTVMDPATDRVIPTKDLLVLLRQNPCFPPETSFTQQPDDSFMINYAVYHHFRSCGWVPRPGVKFGVDWLLYAEGPVFDHAQFGILVLPSYSDPYWKQPEHERQAPKKSWHSFFGTNRVLTRVFKSLVLVYVEIPPPTAFDAKGEPAGGLSGVLKQYKIREVMVKRYSTNRNR